MPRCALLFRRLRREYLARVHDVLGIHRALDPSLQVDKRNETLTALQALATLNNKFMVRMAEHFAARLEAETSDPVEQINRAYELTVNRAPTAETSAALVHYTNKHGLSSACRVIFNLNEFAFAD